MKVSFEPEALETLYDIAAFISIEVLSDRGHTRAKRGRYSQLLNVNLPP
jgi:hypothetical protein